MLISYMLLQMFLYDTFIVHVSLHFIGPKFPTKPNEVDIVHFYNISDIHIGNVKTCLLHETTFATLISDIIFSAIIDYDVDIVYFFSSVTPATSHDEKMILSYYNINIIHVTMFIFFAIMALVLFLTFTMWISVRMFV